MSDETYNGWSNRETWLVNLWLTNDEDAYLNCRGMTAEQLEDMVDRMLVKVPMGLLTDLVNAATVRVNWQEVADSLNAE